MRELFFDTEIVNLIPSGKPEPSYRYCKGWTDYEGMGISVIGCYASWLEDIDKYKYFILDNNYWENVWTEKLPELPYEDIAHLGYLEVSGQANLFRKLLYKADNIIGFNSINFDDRLLKANSINVDTTIDLLQEVRKAAKNHKVDGRGSYKLGLLAEHNLPYTKSGSGELAPVLWQEGKYNEVVSYCLNDVRLLKDLYYMYLDNKLINPNNNKLLQCVLDPYMALL